VCSAMGAWAATTSCSGVTPICGSDGTTCRACATNAECGGILCDTEVIETPATGACLDVECIGDVHCTDAMLPICADNVCVACEPDTYRCTGTTDAGRELCNAGSWEAADCVDPLVCTAGACQ
jgi:hypothetical protein